MGYLNGVGGLERNLLVGQANSEGAVLLNHVNSGHVDQRDMDMAEDMLQKMQIAQPSLFSGPYNQLAWQQQMNGAVNIYNLVQNQLSLGNLSAGSPGADPALPPDLNVQTQPFINAQPNVYADPYFPPQPFFNARPFAFTDPYFMPRPFYGPTMGEEFAGAAIASVGAFALLRSLEGDRYRSRYDPNLDFSRGMQFERRDLRQFERPEPRPFQPPGIRGWR